MSSMITPLDSFQAINMYSNILIYIHIYTYLIAKYAFIHALHTNNNSESTFIMMVHHPRKGVIKLESKSNFLSILPPLKVTDTNLNAVST